LATLGQLSVWSGRREPCYQYLVVCDIPFRVPPSAPGACAHRGRGIESTFRSVTLWPLLLPHSETVVEGQPPEPAVPELAVCGLSTGLRRHALVHGRTALCTAALPLESAPSPAPNVMVNVAAGALGFHLLHPVISGHSTTQVSIRSGSGLTSRRRRRLVARGRGAPATTTPPPAPANNTVQ
jgi:hypothetical protein